MQNSARLGAGVRGRGRRLAAAAAAAIGLVGAAYVFAAPLAERAARAGLQAAGLGPARLKVRALGFSRLVVEDLALGRMGYAQPVVSVGRIEVSFTPLGLARGRVRAVSVSDAHVRVSTDEWGALEPPFPELRLGGGAPSASGPASAAPPVPPVGALSIQDLTVRVATPDGWLIAAAGGAFDAETGGAFEIEAAPFEARRGDVFAALAAASARLSIEAGGAAHTVGELQGAASVQRARLQSLSGAFEASIGDIWTALADPGGAAATARIDLAADVSSDDGVAGLAPAAASALEAIAETEALSALAAALRDALDAAAQEVRLAAAVEAGLDAGQIELAVADARVRSASGLRIEAAASASAPATVFAADAPGRRPVRAQWRLEASGALLPALTTAGEVSAALTGGEVAALQGEGVVQVSPWIVKGGVVGPLALEFAGEPAARGASARLTFEGAADGDFGPVRIDQAIARAAALVSVDWPARRLTAALSDCAAFSAQRVSEAGRAFELADGAICPLTDDEPVVMEVDAADALTLRARARLGAGRVALQADGLEIAGRPPSLQGEATYDAAAGPWAVSQLSVEGGLLALNEEVVVRGLDLAGEAAAPPAGGRIDVRRIEIADVLSPPRFAPLVVSGWVAAADGAADVETVVSAAGRRIASGRGRHDLAAGRGAFAFSTGALSFTGPDRQLAALAPAARGLLRVSEGEVEADGAFEWSPEGLVSEGRVRLRDFGGKTSGGSMTGLNADARFRSLAPPVTAGLQRAAVAALDLGPVRLADGRIAFEVTPDGRAIVERATWAWADGEVGVARAQLRLDDGAVAAPLEIASVDLAQVFALLNIEGLSGEGRVSGAFPVRIEGGEVRIDDGRLASEAPGVLRYTGPRAPGALGVSAEQSDLLFGALSNFHYTSIDMTLNGAVSDALQVRLTLNGANPDFLQGYPFKIALNTRADVSQALPNRRRPAGGP